LAFITLIFFYVFVSADARTLQNSQIVNKVINYCKVLDVKSVKMVSVYDLCEVIITARYHFTLVFFYRIQLIVGTNTSNTNGAFITVLRTPIIMGH